MIRALKSNNSFSAFTVNTIKPPKIMLEELTESALPPGRDFEVIWNKEDVKLKDIEKLPFSTYPLKEVTLIVLEKQPDGNYKVKEVKTNSENTSLANVQTIVEKIRKGEIELLPGSENPLTATIHAPTTTMHSAIPSLNAFIFDSASTTARPQFSFTFREISRFVY